MIRSTVGFPAPWVIRLLIWDDDVRGDDQRRRRLPTLHLGDRLCARVDLDRVDRLIQLAGVLGDVDLLVAEAQLAVSGRHLVEQRHLRLPGWAREREPDHQRDHDRIDDQQSHEQRRALEDLQVLDEQPAHVESVAVLVQKADERGLEVADELVADDAGGGIRFAHGSLELRGRAREQQLAVPENEHSGRVVLGLARRCGSRTPPSCRGRQARR